MKMQYIAEASADNQRAKERIRALKAEIHRLEPQAIGSGSPKSCKKDGHGMSPPSKAQVQVQGHEWQQERSMQGFTQNVVDSPESELVLSASQEEQLHRGIEESLKERVERLTRLKDGLEVLNRQIGQKSGRKEELCKLYAEKKTEME